MLMQSVSAHLAHATCVAMTYAGELLTKSSAWHAQDEEDKPHVVPTLTDAEVLRVLVREEHASRKAMRAAAQVVLAERAAAAAAALAEED